MRNITYAIDPETDLVVSRIGDRIAWPMLDFPANSFAMDYYGLKDFSVFELCGNSSYEMLRWTKKIPVETKNLHRRFWGLSAIKG